MNLTKVLILLSCLVSVGCKDIDGNNEFVQSKYLNYQYASEDGAFERGVLPSIMPPSANNIYEAHNLDSNLIWVRFDFDEDDIATLTSKCALFEQVEFPRRNHIADISNWWPDEFIESSRVNTKLKVRNYLCKNVRHSGLFFDAYLVIDEINNRAWYWVNEKKGA